MGLVKIRNYGAFLFGTLILVVLVLDKPALAQSGMQLSVDPAQSTVPPGNQFTLSLKVTSGVNVNAYDVTIEYDEAILHLDNYEQGDYLSHLWEVKTVNEPGTLRLVYAQLASPPVSGDGILVNLFFRTINPGTTEITLTNGEFADAQGNLITPTLINGVVVVPDGLFPTSTTTASVTMTPTPLPTYTKTKKPTNTATQRPTSTVTNLYTKTSTWTVSSSPIVSRTSTRTRTPTLRVSKSPTIVLTRTQTRTATKRVAFSPTLSITNTPANTINNQASVSATLQSTRTWLPSDTPGSHKFNESSLSTKSIVNLTPQNFSNSLTPVPRNAEGTLLSPLNTQTDQAALMTAGLELTAQSVSENDQNNLSQKESANRDLWLWILLFMGLFMIVIEFGMIIHKRRKPKQKD